MMPYGGTSGYTQAGQPTATPANAPAATGETQQQQQPAQAPSTGGVANPYSRGHAQFGQYPRPQGQYPQAPANYQ